MTKTFVLRSFIISFNVMCLPETLTFGVSPVCFYKKTPGWDFLIKCTTKFLNSLKYVFLENGVELVYNYNYGYWK